MARKAIDQVLGTDKDYNVTIRDSQGRAISTYLLGNPLTARLWRGDDLATLASPAIAWVDPAAGTCKLTVAAADIAGLEPGSYRLQGLVGEAGGISRCFLDVNLRLSAAPGSGAAPKVYCTMEDMTDWFPSAATLLAEADETGFAEQRARARQWVDRRVVRLRGGDSAATRTLLDSDRLLVTDEVVEIAAKKALAIVLQAQLPDSETVQAGRKSAYQAAGVAFAADAEAMLAAWTPELDADGDGTAEEELGGTDTSGGFVISSPTRRCRWPGGY